MLYSVAPKSGLARAAELAGQVPALASWRLRRNQSVIAEVEFEVMHATYRASGGIARVEELVDLFQRQHGPTHNMLADWIERRQVICFEWNDGMWLPWFQFHRVALVPHPQLATVFAELTPIFDHWELASWFAQPNSWLGGRIPVTIVLSDLEAVRAAARADRYIADG